MDVLEKAMTGNIELRARVNALVDAMKDVNRNAGETDGEVRRFLSSLRGSARGGGCDRGEGFAPLACPSSNRATD